MSLKSSHSSNRPIILRGHDWACAVVLAIGGLQVSAQTIPDAGSLLRQTERNLNIPSAPVAGPRREIKTLPPALPGEATVTVERFLFKGSTRLDDAHLQQAIASFVGKPLNFAQLQQAAESVAEAFREAGWVVRAFLPPQEVEQGVVTIEIVEAVFGKTTLSGEPSHRIQAERLVKIVQHAQPQGEALNAANIDRALILLDDLPGVSVSGNLVAGDQEGQTDLNLTVTDEALLTGNGFVDNNGSRSTGSGRLSVNLSLNSPAQWGDAASINLLKTQGSEYQRAAYAVPLGYQGLRGGVHFSNLNYHLIGDFAALGAKGVAQTAGLDLNYPLLRSQSLNLQLAMSYDRKIFDNTANAGSSRYSINAYNFTLSSTHFDTGGSVTSSSASLTAGEKNLEGTYSKLNLNFSRQQILADGLSLLVSASWQFASKNLDSSEKIYLGGASGVRAYPSNEGGGSVGHTLTTELRQRLADRWTLTGFYDHGWALVNRTPALTPSIPASYYLHGAGISLTWLGPDGLDFKVTAAHRINTNPLQSVQGLDTDGSRKLTRLWFTAGKAF